MSLDDWAVKNIEAEARKQWFGDYMKDKVDQALDVIYPVDGLTFDELKNTSSFQITAGEAQLRCDMWQESVFGQFYPIGEESEGVGDQ